MKSMCDFPRAGLHGKGVSKAFAMWNHTAEVISKEFFGEL